MNFNFVSLLKAGAANVGRPKDPRNEAFARIGVFAVSIVLGLCAVWIAFSGEHQDFEATGLGINTTVQDAPLRYRGRKTVCFDVADLEQCLSGLPSSPARKRVLWLGWSQLYAINDMHPGDRTAPSLLAERLDASGIDLIAVAMPNINPREELLVYEYVKRRTPLSGLIVPAWLQGMKQEGIRPGWQPALSDPDVRASLRKLASGASILAAVPVEAKSAQEIGNVKPDEHEPTTQALTENWLIANLSAHFPLWRIRGEAQGELRLALLESKAQVLRLRNLVLGTRADTWINVVPPVRYAINMRAVTDLIGAARQDRLPVLVYVPPRPEDRLFPFDHTVYSTFKADCERLALAAGASFANIENSVADSDWGKINNGAGEIVTDYSHFNAEGHKKMANSLGGALLTTIVPKVR
jgi:hypothetical protein